MRLGSWKRLSFGQVGRHGVESFDKVNRFRTCMIPLPLVFSMAMRDRDIRLALRRDLIASFGDDPTALILDELGICCGTVRVDMAVVNGTLKGFEIKSDRDTLDRLPTQASVYNKVFDTLTVVVGTRHLHKVEAMVPEWWGISLVDGQDDAFPRLQNVRSERLNSDLDPLALVQLLWRDEALALLHANGMGQGLGSKPRQFLWEVLANNLPLSDLRDMVRTQLKARRDWRVGS